ncbi:MAG: SUMF1/EgtB/PvdO family nonheme iron enzyme [Acidobacteria bacterium]|nr:SUMF1/EgtB/PvdO family nonheme iron enzyme [Acidobacteriota bacterium]MBI3424108.1 SUMF1/EgtB/PvdO family nonheme iron enzyme [Acidobacteriota bacterium]
MFCKRCGLDRDRALQLTLAAAGKTSAFNAGVTREVVADASAPRCNYCGAETTPHSHFCENCGMRQSPSANGAPVQTQSTPVAPPISKVDVLATTIEEDEPLISVKDLFGATVVNLEQQIRKSNPTYEPTPPVEPQLETENTRVTGERAVEKKRVTTQFPPPPGDSVSSGAAGAQLKTLRQALGEDASTHKIASQMDAIPTALRQPSVETQRIGQRTRWATWMVMFAMALLAFLLTAVWQTSRQPRSPGIVSTPSPEATASVQSQASPETNAQVPADMVYVPGGLFEMGRTDGDDYEKPAHFVAVKAFYLDRTEVTNEQYKAFVDATGRAAPQHWRGNQPPAGEAKHPVVNVSWNDAVAYAEWVGKRLPTEEEWEFAARGTDGRLYPWGAEWHQDFANTAESGTSKIVEVGRYPGGASPFGALDLCGNVWEWTASELRSYQTQEAIASDQQVARKVIRGGAYDVRNDRATTTYRGVVQADKVYPKTGFRCVRDVQ